MNTINNLQQALVIFLFFIGVNIFVYNSGGIGLQLPSNIFVTFTVLLMLMLLILKVFLTKKITVDIVFFILLCFFISTLIPLIYAYNELAIRNLDRYIVYLLVPLVYLSLINMEDKLDLLKMVYYSSWVQLAVGYIQILLPIGALEPFILTGMSFEKGAFSTFQQINMYALFLTFGAVVAIFCFKNWSTNERVGALVYITLCIYMMLSRESGNTGKLIFFVSLIFSLLSQLKLQHYVSKKNAFLFVIGISVVSLFLIENSNRKAQVSSSKELYSNIIGQRIIIYDLTLSAILDKPLFGHGVGKFASYYAIYQGQTVQDNLDFKVTLSKNLSHPHNEFLLLLFEFGFVWLLILCALVLMTLRLSPNIQFKSDLRYFSLLLPFFLSANLTYPTKLSYLNLFVFLVLLSVVFKDSSKKQVNFSSFYKNITFFVVPLLVLVCTYSINSFSAVKANHIFVTKGDFTRFKEIPNFHVFSELVDGLVLLERVKKNPHDYELVNQFIKWTESAVLYQPREALYTNLVSVLVAAGRYREAFFFSLESAKRYPYSKKVKKQFYPLRELYEKLEQQYE